MNTNQKERHNFSRSSEFDDLSNTIFQGKGTDERDDGEHLELDTALLQRVEELCDGGMAHLCANACGVYRSLIETYRATHDPEIKVIADAAYTELQKILTRLRLSKCRLPSLYRE